ncbi:hypothetical protein HK105_207303 [Polyrhizophydium stewartii]|uniref:Uncharacterized protein n=1 Tax=Polyrhizophydium stewartii TaxID=2732419 RepID=A0ABR4N0Z7_9FUNG|nr:hypothetical protein HK105_000510 [Polyrhizophydium stewartii]
MIAIFYGRIYLIKLGCIRDTMPESDERRRQLERQAARERRIAAIEAAEMANMELPRYERTAAPGEIPPPYEVVVLPADGLGPPPTPPPPEDAEACDATPEAAQSIEPTAESAPSPSQQADQGSARL